MAVKKGGLGKGLDSLIPSGNPKTRKTFIIKKKIFVLDENCETVVSCMNQ